MRERSQAEKDLVTKVMEGKSSTEPLVSEGPDSLTRQSMQTLCHGDWVNDEVINFFGNVYLNKHDISLRDRHDGRKCSH
jgi:Ulp1 family protease